MHTTLNKIRAHSPCAEGWEKLLRHLGKTRADDEPVPILTVLDANGLDDALWCLRAVDGHDREIRLYAVWCARQIQPLMTAPRSLAALDTAERFANGKAAAEELKAARDAAWDPACDPAWDAAWAAARDAAWAAARDAALDATWDAARDAAWDAAWAAALDAALDAARVATWDATWDAAWAAARGAQEKELRRILG